MCLRVWAEGAIRAFAMLFLPLLLAELVPVKSQDLELTIAQAQALLASAPVYVAREKYFEDLGMDVNVIITPGSAQTAAAVQGGSAQFGVLAASDFLDYVLKGVDFLAVGALNYGTQEVTANRQWVESQGLTRELPLETRIRALPGAIGGATAPGATSETMLRYLLAYAGQDPSSMRIVALGGLTVRLAALERNQIQVMVDSPPGGPLAEQTGYGYILIPSEDMPQLYREGYNEVLVVRKSWMKENQALTARIVSSLVKSCNLLLENPKDALGLIFPYFEHLSEGILQQSLDMVLPMTVPSCRMNAQSWGNSVALLKKIGRLQQERLVDLTEGVYWTNHYIDQASKELRQD